MEIPLKIYLADDHQILIDGLTAFFNKIAGIEVVGTANDGLTMLRELPKRMPDMVLLDLNMPKMDGLTTLERVRKEHPHIRVIILSNYHQTRLITEAKEKGAHGYLLKNGSQKELLEAIEAVRSGHTWFVMPEKAEPEINPLFSDQFMKKFHLTKREVEIIRMVCMELNSREIGEKLFIAELTVNTHRRNILSKLDIKNTPALINFARENGII